MRNNDNVKLTTEPETITVEVSGTEVEVELDQHGMFRPVFKKFFEETGARADLSFLIGSLENAIDEERARKERVQLLKQMETAPVPAMLYDRGTFCKIGVRGVDQRSGNLLITRQGQKAKAEPGRVMRVLTDEEIAEHDRLKAEISTLRAAIPEPTQYGDIISQFEFEGTATFDGAKFHYGEFVADSLNELQGLLKRDFVIRQGFALASHYDEVAPLSEISPLYNSTKIFRTQAEFDAWQEAGIKERDAVRAANQWDQEHRFSREGLTS